MNALVTSSIRIDIVSEPSMGPYFQMDLNHHPPHSFSLQALDQLEEEQGTKIG